MSSAKETKAENVKLRSGNNKVVYRAPSGMFQRKSKAPTAVEFQQAVASKLLAVSPEKNKSDLEEIIEAQTIIAKDTDLERGTSSQKAAEFLVKTAGLYLAKPEDQPRGMLVVQVPLYDLPFVELKPIEPIVPSEQFLKEHSIESTVKTAEVTSIFTNPPRRLGE